MVIDIHTHTFPDKIAASAIAGMESTLEKAQGFSVKAASSGTYDELSKSSAEAGIDVSVVLPVATNTVQPGKVNAASAKLNEKYSDSHVFYFGMIHPDCSDYKHILDEICSMDLRGIKLHPDYQGVFFDDERYIRIIDYAAEKNLMIVVHAGEDIGLPRPVHVTPDRILRVLGHIQPEKMVLAHMGSWRMWDEVEEKLCGLPVYFDTAFTLRRDIPHMDSDQFVRICRKHGADRILFGTDSPWYDQSDAVSDIGRVGLTEEELAMIMGKNAEKMLNF